MSNAELIERARAMRMDSEVGTHVERMRILGELANALSASDAVIAEVHSLVMNTDGDYLDGDDFDGLAGEIQRALRDGGVITDNPQPRDLQSKTQEGTTP